MVKAAIAGLGLLLFAGAAAAQSVNVEVANLREDVRLLAQRIGDLSIRVEQLERENAALRGALGNSSAYAIVELTAAIKSGDETVAASAAAQIKKLGDATNAALDSIARSAAARPPAPTTFSDNYPSEGISYTVQKGDTIALIARKTGAKVADIINANKIADPTRIRVGDVLFVPGGK